MEQSFEVVELTYSVVITRNGMIIDPIFATDLALNQELVIAIIVPQCTFNLVDASTNQLANSYSCK